MTVPQNYIKLCGRTQFAPTSREQPPCCSAKSHQNLRAGVETRPYKRGAESSPPTLAWHFYFSIGTVKTVPLPCKMHFVRRPQERCNLLRVVEVTAAPLPLCRCATFPLTGESHRPLRTKWNAFALQTQICHPARSEGFPIAQNKPARNEILRLSAQNDN